MATAARPLQRAVYQQLVGDPVLTARAGVYDEVPETARYPHVVIREITETPLDSHDRQGLRADVHLSIWSRYRGFTECAEVLELVDGLLDRVPLVVPGWADVSIAHDFHAFLRDPNPDLRHCPIRYRVWLSQE